MKTLAEIRARMAEIKPEMETLGEAESLDETQETRLDELVTEWETLEADEKKAEERAKVLERVRAARVNPGAVESGDGPAAGANVEVMRRVEPFAKGDNPERMTRMEARDKALKALDLDNLTEHLDERQKVALSTLLRKQSKNTDGAMIARRLLVTESEAYRSAFMKRATSDTPVFTAEEGEALQRFNEFRAMTIGTDAAGGFGVPVLIDPTIILTAQGSSNPVLELARVETISTDEWRGVSSAGVSWSFDAELEEVSDDSPTLAQPTVKAEKAQGFIPFSIEVGMDYPGFASEMATLLSEGYRELLAEVLVTGSGASNNPTGIVTALTGTTSRVVSAGAGTFTAADVNSLWAALPERYRANAAWLSNTTINGLVQQFGNGADASFTVGFTAEGVTVVKGRQFRTSDYMSSTLTGTTPYLIVGDWRNYLVAQRAGMSVELIPHLFGTANNRPNGSRGWYAWARVGADSINDSGFRALVDSLT